MFRQPLRCIVCFAETSVHLRLEKDTFTWRSHGCSLREPLRRATGQRPEAPSQPIPSGSEVPSNRQGAGDAYVNRKRGHWKQALHHAVTADVDMEGLDRRFEVV